MLAYKKLYGKSTDLSHWQKALANLATDNTHSSMTTCKLKLSVRLFNALICRTPLQLTGWSRVTINIKAFGKGAYL